MSMSAKHGVLAGLIIGVALSIAPARVQAQEKRIAVVNVSHVFASYSKVKDVQTKMEKLFEPEKKAIEAEGRKLQDLEVKLKVDGRNPKTDLNFFKELQAFELAKMDLEIRFNKLAEQVETKRKEEMKGVLKDIKLAIGAIGTSERFDLVLRAPEFDDEMRAGEGEQRDEPRSAADLVRRFRENPVLYFATGVDVTSKVIGKLNDDYRAAGKVN